MTILSPQEPSTPTLAGAQAATDADLRALWRRIDALGKGGGGSGLVIISDTKPDAESGTLWYNTGAEAGV